MVLQGRNLTQGVTGADIATLHTQLAELGYAVPAAEVQASQFGAGTLTAVEQVQAAAGLTASGTVDAATASALDVLIQRSTYAVSGHVTSTTSAGMGGLSVRLVDKNVGGDVTLATAITDATGAYSVSVVIGAPTLRGRSKTAPDLQSQVIEPASATPPALVAVSAVAISATSPLVLDVALPANAPNLLSEYETLTASLARIYSGRLKDLNENDTTQDVTYLGAKSGWDARAVAMASLADQFSTFTPPAPPPPASSPPAPPPPAAPPAATGATPVRLTAATAIGATTATAIAATGATSSGLPATPIASTVLAPPAGLPAAFYYALFRAGVPADADTMFQTRPAAVSAIWTQAIAQGVIPASFAAAIPQAMQTFQALAGTHLLTMPPKIGISTINDLVTPLLTGTGQPAQFSALLAAHAGDWTTFWSAVGMAFGTATAQKLQLAGQLSYLTLDNAPLLAALDKAEAKTPLAAPIDLATRGYWDAGEMDAADRPVGAGRRARHHGAGQDGQLRRLARRAGQAVVPDGNACPTGQIRHHSAREHAGRSGEAADFLAAHQVDFAFGVEPVESVYRRAQAHPVKHGGLPSQAPATGLSDDHADRRSPRCWPAMLIRPMRSPATTPPASCVPSGQGRRRCCGAGHPQPRQADPRRHVECRDELRHPAGRPRAWRHVGDTLAASADHGSSGQTVAAATLDGLFGSLDTCGCDDCESMLSPSAYLVDLLHYLDQPATASGVNPQTILFGRRPDLQFLPLTCENTETALPYIDVANELLEYFVANGLKIGGFQGFDTGDHVTSAELDRSAAERQRRGLYRAAGRVVSGTVAVQPPAGAAARAYGGPRGRHAGRDGAAASGRRHRGLAGERVELRLERHPDRAARPVAR